jgi:protein FRA10AC1
MSVTGSAGPPSGPSAFERHQHLIADYVKFYGHVPRRDTSRDRSDVDVLRDAHRFVRSDADNDDSTYEKRLARRYYDLLFKEYCLADLSLYRKSRIGLRWRTQAEVFAGKGQFQCANVACDESRALKSYEVEFRYDEAGEAKVALVKVRVCRECAFKLNYKHFKRIADEKRRKKRDPTADDEERRKRRRRVERGDADADDDKKPALDDSEQQQQQQQQDAERRADALLAQVADSIAAEAARSRARLGISTGDAASSAMQRPAEFAGLFE